MKKLLASMLFTGAALYGQISIRIGPPPPPRVVAVPARPGPDFIWVDGYWYPVGGRYRWHGGYWTRPPYPGAHWTAPHHDGQAFFAGAWEGDHGRIEHDHRWDRERDRDFHEHH